MAMDINLLKAKKAVDAMVRNGEPPAYIDGFLSKVGYSAQQIKDTPLLDDKMLIGAEKLSQDPKYWERAKKIEQGRENIQDLEKFQGDARNIGNMLTFNLADEAESGLTGHPLSEIKKEEEEYARKNPVRNIVSNVVGAVINPLNAVGAGFIGKGANLGSKIARGTMVGSATGAAYGLGENEDNIEDRLGSAGTGAITGAAIGGVAPAVGEGLKKGIRGIARGAEMAKDRAEKLPFVGKLLTKSQDELEDEVAKLSGMPKSEESAGQIARGALENISGKFKSESSNLYNKADELASGAKIPLNKNSNLAQELRNMYEESTKTGKRYLGKVWDEIGRNPNYKQVRGLQSMLSADSKSGVSGLTASQVGKIKSALDKDIELGIGSEAKSALDSANKFYRNEMGNPNSLMSAVEDLHGAGNGLSDSEIGRRVISGATSRAGKQTALKNILSNTENPDELRSAIMANITRKANFNNMSPEQRALIYGDKAKEADAIFNGRYLKYLTDLLKGVADKTDKINSGALVMPATQISGMNIQ